GGSGSGEFRLQNGNGFANAKLHLGAGVIVHQLFNPPNTSPFTTTQNIGELSGDVGATLGGQPVSGRFVNWTAGALNTNSTYSGAIVDDAGAARLTKVGTGTLTLDGTASTFTGGVTVSAGTLKINN